MDETLFQHFTLSCLLKVRSSIYTFYIISLRPFMAVHIRDAVRFGLMKSRLREGVAPSNIVALLRPTLLLWHSGVVVIRDRVN